MNIFLLDNYDSFTFNLVHLLEKNPAVTVTVKRNDEVEMEELESFDKIILSPGPGLPDEAGLLKSLIKHYAGKKPILGVCLGHQAIVEVFGGQLINLPKVLHGISTPCQILPPIDCLFKDLPETIAIGRYHSWVADTTSFPETLQATALDDAGNIMAFKHREWDVRGVQFHPESVLTPDGQRILDNWINS